MFLLKPAAKDYLWGGTLLQRRFGKGKGLDIVAESWELSTHPDGLTLIEENNISLREYLRNNPQAAGFAAEDGDIPILVKLIDAQKPLSVQVHPNDEYAARSGQRGKTEIWYVMDAAPDAYLYLGVSRPVTRADLEECIKNNTVESILKKVPVKAGECYFIPAGMLHAIGAGCVIYEVQQSSNITYRVYDYGRKGADGKPRQLHIQEALEVAALEPVDTTPPGKEDGVLVDCPYFRIEEMEIPGEIVLNVPGDRFCHSFCLEGSVALSGQDCVLTMTAGTGAFIKAGQTVRISGKGRILAAYPGMGRAEADK